MINLFGAYINIIYACSCIIFTFLSTPSQLTAYFHTRLKPCSSRKFCWLLRRLIPSWFGEIYSINCSACNMGDWGSIPGLGRSPGEGHGNPLQYSGLENPHGQRSLVGYSREVAKSQTRLSDWHFHFHVSTINSNPGVIPKCFASFFDILLWFCHPLIYLNLPWRQLLTCLLW